MFTFFLSPARVNTNSSRFWWLLAPLLLLLTVCITSLSAQSLPAGFANSQIQSGYTTPVGVVFSTDGRQLFVWEKTGRVFVSNWNGSTYVRQNTPVIDISPEVGNWRDFGLLSICLDPNFGSNGLLYLFYAVDRHHLLYAGNPALYNPAGDQYYDASISRVSRYRINNTNGTLTADVNSRFVLLGETKSTGIPLVHESHAGGTLLFGRDGTLLISTGDNATYEGVDTGSNPNTYFQTALNDGILRPAENVGSLRSQMIGSLCGKVLRINPTTGDGVSSNPFYDAANPRAARSRVWALGLRNPYRMAMQPGTGSTNPADANPGTLLLSDVGWNTAEEFDVVDQAGLNFGWPLYEGMDQTSYYYGMNIRNQDEAGQPTFESLCRQPTSPAVDSNPANRHLTHTRPVLDWNQDAPIARVPAFTGSTASSRIIGSAGGPTGTPFSGNASIGGVYYTGSQFPASYLNSYFFVDFGQNWIRNAVVQNNAVTEVRAFAAPALAEGIVALALNPLDGSLYFVVIDGQIRRISYGANQPPVARPSADVTSGTSSLTVHFSGASSTDPEGRPLQFRWDFGDGTSSTETNPTHTFSSPDERSFTITLTVTDEGGLSHAAPVTVSLNGTAPTARITSPTDGSRYPVDRASLYTLTAATTGTNLTYQWQVSLLHNDHEHPEPVLTAVSPQIQISPVGCSGTDVYSYRIDLKVTNRSGQSAATSVRIYPDCPTTSPSASGFAITGVTMVRCETITTGQRQLSFTPQYAGLNGQPVSVSVVGEMLPTSLPGPYTLRIYTDNPIITLKARQTGTAGEASFAYGWLNACNAGGSASSPGTPTNQPPANQPPRLTQAIAEQRATVGQPFTFVVPGGTFTDPDNQPLTYTMSGLPAGLRFDGPSASLTGTPTTAAQSTITLTATDPANLSASTQFLLTVSNAATPPPPAPSSGNFAISGVTTVQCLTLSAGQRQLSFTPQYAGLNGQPVSVSVVGEMLPTSLPGPYTLRIYTDNPIITLKARQTGTAGEASFAYGWLAACNAGGSTSSPGTPTNQPPANQPPRLTQAIAEQRATVGQPFTFVVPGGTFTDPDNQPLTYTMSGLPPGLRFDGPSASLTGTPTTAAQSTVTLTATDPANLSASTQFLLTVSNAATPPPTPPSGSFAITGVTTVECVPVSATKRQLSFTPQYTGMNGQPVTVSVVGEMLPSTNPGPYTLNMYIDNPVITIKARQAGTAAEVSFSYGWLAACNAGGSGRLNIGTMEPLTVRVLGNPILTETVEVEMFGASGEWLHVQTLDPHGRRLYEATISQPAPAERRSFNLIGPAGMYLMHVSTPTQHQVLKLIKQ